MSTFENRVSYYDDLCLSMIASAPIGMYHSKDKGGGGGGNSDIPVEGKAESTILKKSYQCTEPADRLLWRTTPFSVMYTTLSDLH